MSNNGFAVDRDPLFNENNLIWMDLEMTGLEPQINRILEMAAVITDRSGDGISSGGSGRRGERGPRRQAGSGLEREGYQDAGSSVGAL